MVVVRFRFGMTQPVSCNYDVSIEVVFAFTREVFEESVCFRRWKGGMLSKKFKRNQNSFTSSLRG